jgi:hypothetical protein
MQEVVNVSSVENLDQLTSYIDAHFAKNKYAEITQAIGIYSLLIDSEHTISDQRRFYRQVLNLLKDRIKARLGKSYAAWYASFPALASEAAKLAGSDKSAADAIDSRLQAFGPFKSVDDFFFWALDDRRLTLDRIVNMIEKTVQA